MSRIREVFGVDRVLLPVVHPVARASALENVRIAVECGIRGIFLINQGMGSGDVLALVNEVRDAHPSLWIGINLLGMEPERALEQALGACSGRIDAIWCDDAGIDEDSNGQPLAQRFADARRRLGWNGLYFGGVAFKYQREVPADKLERAAALAAGYMDVVCTSGPGTGMEAKPEKLAAMRRGLSAGGALALASGVTEANVSGFLPYADAYLVGTSIEECFGVFDRDAVARLNHLIVGGTIGGSGRDSLA